MTQKKYTKYIVEYDSKKWPNERRIVTTRMEDSVARGSYFYKSLWVMPDHSKPYGDYKYAGHPPHIHKDAELLFHLGTNPEDPTDLGGEVLIYLGPEMEEHHFNRTCCIYIPPNFIHSPWRPLKTTRPWLFMEVNQGPVHTEKSYRQLLPKDAREKTDWSLWPDEGYETPREEAQTIRKRKAEADAPYRINTDKCLKCGLCVIQCQEKAITVDGRITESDGLVLYTTKIAAERCTGCGVCFSNEWWCPAGAIIKT